MIYAFKDNHDGYYQVDVPDGISLPEWTVDLQPCDIINAPGPSIPQSVTMRQARIALFNAGLLLNVDAAIASLAEPQQTIAKISWDYSSTVERNNPVFIQLATALGLNSAQIDQFMINASKL